MKKQILLVSFSLAFASPLFSDDTDDESVPSSAQGSPLDDHLNKLGKIKAEIMAFRLKNLEGSFQFAKYYNYIKEHSLESHVHDPIIDRLYKLSKNTIEKRKASCTDTMNLQPPLSLELPKNQGATGWCYAFVGSDLIANASGKEPSAIYMANLVNSKFSYRLLGMTRGGNVKDAIERVSDKGICYENHLPSTGYKFSTHTYNLDHVFRQVVKLSKKYHYRAPVQNFPSHQRRYTKEEVLADLRKNHAQLLASLGEIFPRTPVEYIAMILNEYEGAQAFKKIAENACPVSQDQELKNLRVTSTSKHIFETLDQQLNRGNIVAITYKSEMLTNYKDNALSAGHASSIIGRRFNKKNQSCEYLLRNSWGKECSYYSADYDCKDGHVWIAEDFFKYTDAIKKLQYIEI